MRLSARLVLVASLALSGCPTPVSPLEISPSTLSLEAGSSANVEATREGVRVGAVTWSSSDEAIATISGSTVRALAVGTATLTAKLENESASLTVTVTPATLKRLEIAPGRPIFAIGTKLQLTGSAVSGDGTKRDVTTSTTWRSTDTSIVTVSASGEVRSVAVGTTTISGEFEGRTSNVTVTVTSAVMTSLEVSPTTAAIITGATQRLTATGVFSDSSRQDLSTQVTWASSAAGVARVDSLGVVTAVTMGSATITATRTGFSATATISTTTAVLQSIEVTPATVTLAKGTTRQLVVNGRYSNGLTLPVTASWVSATPAAATISAAGLVTAVNPGSSLITATVSGLTATSTVTVTAAQLVGIDVTPAAPSVSVGLTRQLTATGRFSDTTTQDLTAQVLWASATAANVTVSNAGVVTAVAVGSSVISATLSGVTGNTTVTVTAAQLASIAVTPATPGIAKGLTQQFTATGTFTDTTTQVLTSSVTWASSDGGVLTISDAGLATAVEVGVVEVTATQASVSGSTTVTVGAAEVVSIVVAPATASVAEGATQQFTASGTYSDTSTGDVTSLVTWSSADAGVATIASSGLATGVAAGVTQIVATHGSAQGSATLTVTPPAVLVSIAITPSNPSISAADTQQFTATGTYSDSSTSNLTATAVWASSNPATATILPGGLADGVVVGTTTISATVGAISGSTTLTVTP